MTKLICDKCGNEIRKPAFDEDQFPRVRIEIQFVSFEKYRVIDLCDDCREAFLKWMGNEHE